MKTKSAFHRNRSALCRPQKGLTLVEWMVSIAIGLILLAGLTALIAQQSGTQGELEKSSRQIENGRYALQLLQEDVRLAGYYGEFSNVAGLAVPGALPDPCAVTASALETAMAFPVQGYDSLASGQPSCINSADHVSGTDILVVRRVEPETITVAAAAATGGQVYLQSGLTTSGLEFTKKLDIGSNTANFTLFKKDLTTLAPLRKLLVHVYYVSPCYIPAGANCSSAADDGRPIPTLKRLELSATGPTTTTVVTPLVEGIENMQIDYGIDTTGDGSPDGQFVAAPASIGAWSDLVALRVHLLVRSNDPSSGYVDSKTYAMGYNSAAVVQTVSPTSDTYGNNVRPYKRRIFSQMIRLVNPSSRREL